MKEPGLPTLKTLFAYSCNVCAYPQCEEKLTDPAWKAVKGQVAHIYGEKPGSARHDPTMTDEQRHGYDNLILLCPNHHRLIDALDAESHPPELLITMKSDHESRCSGTWAEESKLELFAEMLLATVEGQRTQFGQPTVINARPRLVVERGERDSVDVVNRGDADAINIIIEPVDNATRDAFVMIAEIAPGRLSPGARWNAAAYAATLDNAGPHVVRVTWADDAGNAYSGEFPL